MQKSREFTGRTEEAAVSAALSELGLSRDEVSVEVLQLAKSGFLGIGGTPAKVKVTYEVAEDVPEREEAVEERQEPERARREPDAPVEEAKPVLAVQSAAGIGEGGRDEKAERIDAFLTGLLQRMGVEAECSICVDGQGNYTVELLGRELGQIIGRRGETLDAIQQLAGYAVNRGESRRVRVRVDAEGYRAKREASLVRMANRVADKVLRYRRNFTLEPMNAYERHVIHTALQERADVNTFSVGTEPNRRVVVSYEPGSHRG